MNLKSMIVAAVMAAAATAPAAAQTLGSQEREGAVMLYFSKSLGHARSPAKAPLQFGLRFDQVATMSSRTLVSMFDARLSTRGRTTLAAMGMPMFDSALEGNRWFASFDSGSGRMPTVGKVGLGLLAAAAAACLAEWELCESGDSEDSDDGYTPPSGG